MLEHKRIWLLAGLASCLALAGCGQKRTTLSQRGTGTSSEPDKVLFDRAVADIQHSRYSEARLTLQTLINTYPDSEYLAKAKLGVADSYFKEGGTSGYTQAVAEYQDFITFFPFLDEASYAQMQIGMTHYHRMEKPDRDRNEAIQAESAFQTYLQKYPNSELTAQVEQRLRDVQEVLAEGDFRVAYFYYLRHVDRASAARLLELVNRYPLYSEADRANWMLGSIYERSEHNEIAGQYYTRIVKDYPLSPLASGAKDKLVKFGVPVPQPDPASMARMQKEQDALRPRGNLLTRPLTALVKTGPDVRMAARGGAPTLTPDDSDNSDTLTPGGSLTVGASVGSNGAAGSSDGASGAGGVGTGAFVETVTPGSPTSLAPSTNGTAGATASGNSGSAAGDASSATTTSAGDAASSGDAATPATGSSTPSPSSDPKNESSSKKKKGVRKVLPF
jgi:outer membrane protein assembly factor BamD